jgi:hypothetical protein
MGLKSEPLEVSEVRKMPDGTFAGADALQKLRIVQDGFTTATEKFTEDFYRQRRKRHSIYPLAPR